MNEPNAAYCPLCGTKTEVIDSRQTKTYVRRRRRCPKHSDQTYSTKEIRDSEYKYLLRCKRALLSVADALRSV